MGKRALFGFIYAGGLIGILGFTSYGTYMLAFFTLLLLNEVARILDVQSRLPLLTFTSLFLIGGAIGNWGGPEEIISATLAIGIMMVLALLRAERPAHEMRRGLFALAYVFLPMALIIQTTRDFSELILFIFTMIWASDTFAYLAGRSFGKRPFAPKLSPKKTIEGFAGGVVGTIITGFAVNHYWDLLDVDVALALAAVVSITAPFGDLVASSLKREADVKDSGVFLPGHGGALDRLDSFLTAAPIAILIYQYMI
jgi:phosphatidate cytidylyltransferase